MPRDERALEPSAEAMREMIDLATQRIVRHIESLPQQPTEDIDGAEELSRSLVEGLPESGRPFDELLELLFERVVPKSLNTASPGFLAYIPGGGLFESAVADMMADVVNRYTTVWNAAPGLATLEANTVRWFCGMVGYPSDAGGFLASGGSMANLSAIVTARRDRLPEDFLNGTIYMSNQTHHSIVKAGMIAGFPERNVRTIAVDSGYRIRIEALRERIREDREAGMRPFMIVGSAGTTNTGAVDDLDALADVARDEEMWLHHDAAYGGFFMLTERGREVMHGIERADSITLDPHKGLFLPYGTGCLLARDVGALERAHRYDADYMPARHASSEFPSFCDLSPELSRDFRGLRVWLPLKHHGAGAFREALVEKLDLTEWATEKLRRMDGIEIVARPQLTVVAFRLVRPGLDGEALNELNREFLRRINSRQRVNLTGTVVDERFVLRICVLSLRTHHAHVRMALEDVGETAAELSAA